MDIKQLTNPSILSPSLQICASTLNVLSLSRMEQYYRDIVGLEILERDEKKAIFGHGKRQILILKYEPDLQFPTPMSAGLYHNAIVFTSRGILARTLLQILQKSPKTFTGSADHLVSETFYFTDPEGNGLELYFDRDKSTWEWEQGKIKMASIYLDPRRYIQEYASTANSEEKHIGHIHLKVGDIEKAKQFYVSILGFDMTAEMPSALFVSVGGYHHHLGMNTWESYGASKRAVTLGLKEFELQLANQRDIQKLKERLTTNKIVFHEQEKSIIVDDPWNNKMIITS
ncbi:VOC family protein [soil metagenome]